MTLQDTVRNHPIAFMNICKVHEVKALYAFGSSTTSLFNEERSDIDLLVELETQDPIARGENLMNLWEQLERFFQKKVDLLTDASIRNPILRKNIEATRVLIYDGKK